MSTQQETVGRPARTAALALIAGGLAKRGGFDEAMGRPPFSALDGRERAFALGLAATTLRRLGTIDRLLSARMAKAPPEPVLALLRIGVAQVLFRDTPAFAAVASTVDLAGLQQETQPFKGLINAVLRRVAEAGAPDLPVEADTPDWLLARWRAAYGEEAAARIAACVAVEPATDLNLKDRADSERLAGLMEGEPLPGGGVRTSRRGELSEWPEYAAGNWWVQDAAAAIPARLLDPRPGETALDLCAAPGGKTLRLAAMGARVTALDRSASRLKRLGENLARTGLGAEVAVADATDWEDARTFDAVLLDAPCSATGTFRRHPDVLWGARPGDIGKLAALQRRLLDSAARRVRAGGRLVYCVCSLEPEEGEAQASAFLARTPGFRRLPIAPGEGAAPTEALTADGALRILPFMGGGMDGFHVTRFARLAD